jgi:hypothetical protein
MKLNPNCSEAVYRIHHQIVAGLTERQYEILQDILGKDTLEELIKNPNTSEFMYRTYFENVELDFFLDYFDIPSDRNHWTVSATSGMTREAYNKEMEIFCIRYNLPFKDVYDTRGMGDNYDGEINS